MAYQPELYIHELDRKAFAALKAFPKFIKLWEVYNANYNEKIAKIELMSSGIRLSENQMPEIYGQLEPICEKLGIDIPDLYYVKSEEINAYTGGSTTPYVVVTSELVEKVPAEAIGSVLAHECGHIACKHSLYHSLAYQMIHGADDLLQLIPGLRRYLTPTLVRALLFWDRCSELSADRAAVLCDGSADKTVDMLLDVHGYDKNINREEFIKQALDLRNFVNDSTSNKIIEEMLIRDESHPRMATRIYECYEWAKSEQYRGILDGTYTVDQRRQEIESTETQEVLAADVILEKANDNKADVPSDVQTIDLDQELARVNKELDRYTSHADKADYALAVASGIMAGIIDAVYVGETSFASNSIALSHKQVNQFIQGYAENRGLSSDRLKDAISDLEETFKVAQDNVWKGAGIGVSAKNHHLADLAHHPTPLGLMSAIVVQFLRIGTFVNKDGEWHFKLVKTTGEDIIEILAPAVLTGMLNWIVSVSESEIEDEEQKIPEAIKKLARAMASYPMVIEVAKCADNWFGHLVSDMGGSKNTAGGGMGIPGVFLSLLYEVAALPVLKDSGLPLVLNNLYEKQKFDLRHELTVYKALGKQAIPVIFNELYVRVVYFLAHLMLEIDLHKGIKGIDWNNVVPFNNRTIDRMMTVASMTFTVADTADAAVHAAIESGGNWVLFAGRFVTRFNYVGAGRAAVAVVKEISSERKEAQLIHEKLILTQAKTMIVLQQLQDYKQQLEERLSEYLVEDITVFLEGFDYISEGIETGNSNLVIHGNVVIQRVLGREPQFTNQEEFDDLMESDIALKL